MGDRQSSFSPRVESLSGTYACHVVCHCLPDLVTWAVARPWQRNHKGMPRMLQPYQRVMRAGYDWRLSKRAPGVDLAFLRDQDKAFAELQEVLCGKPAKQVRPSVRWMVHR